MRSRNAHKNLTCGRGFSCEVSRLNLLRLPAQPSPGHAVRPMCKCCRLSRKQGLLANLDCARGANFERRLSNLPDEQRYVVFALRPGLVFGAAIARALALVFHASGLPVAVEGAELATPKRSYPLLTRSDHLTTWAHPLLTGGNVALTARDVLFIFPACSCARRNP